MSALICLRLDATSLRIHRSEKVYHARSQFFGPLQRDVMDGIGHPVNFDERRRDHTLGRERRAAPLGRQKSVLLCRSIFATQPLRQDVERGRAHAGEEALGVLIPHRSQDPHVALEAQARRDGIVSAQFDDIELDLLDIWPHAWDALTHPAKKHLARRAGEARRAPDRG